MGQPSLQPCNEIATRSAAERPGAPRCARVAPASLHTEVDHFDTFGRLEREGGIGRREIESHSRDYLLFGDRLLALAQSDDATIEFAPIGARSAKWNREECLNANRGA